MGKLTFLNSIFRPFDQNTNLSFGVFVFKNPANKKLFYVALVVITLQFIIFKLLYPFPDFFSDSYSYIFGAYAHLDANIWPIGYSKFLLFFHKLTHSSLALVAFQYYFWELSLLYFYFTIHYFHPFQPIAGKFIFLFLFCNPLFLYVANYISSDALFISLSLLWISQLIWILHRPRLYQILIQAILLYLAFTIRYNAMIYPIIAALAFLMSPYKAWAKILGIISGPVLLIPFIIISRNAAREMTGTAQFPILSGWQWGNNALYMRNYIEVDTMAFPTKETAELDHIARDFFRNTEPQKRDLANYVANFFIRKGNAPLKQYLYKHYRMNNDAEQVVAWGMVSPVFGQYGLFLIKRHPIAFARYFMLMNCKNYFLPPLEKLEIYNLGQDKMWPIGQFWFSYSSDKVWCVSKYLQGLILIIFPILYLLLNLFYGSTFAILMQQQGFHKGGDHFAKLIILISAFLLLNFIFSIFANIIVIRYQIFPMTLFAIFGMVMLKYILLNLKTRQLERGKDMTPAKHNVMMPQ